MTVTSLFKQRASIYNKQLSRYAKYVLNDHMVLALLIMLGAGGFAYSNYVETVTVGAVLPRLILVVLMVVVISSGTISTLIQSADAVFLLPMEEGVRKELKKRNGYSFLLLAFPVVFAAAAAMPLLVATLGIGFQWWPVFLITAVSYKFIDLRAQFSACLEPDDRKRMMLNSLGKVISTVGLLISVFIDLFAGLAFSLAVCVISTILLNRIEQQKSLQWHYLIEKEANRVQKLFRFINLFTEVSFIETHPRRLKWLDQWIALQSRSQADAHYFYILRSFYRNSSYSGLVLRLVLIGTLFIMFSPGILLKLILSIVFLYLIGFQLIPIYQQFKNNFYFQLYPVEETGKIKSIQRIITEILGAAALVFTAANIPQGIISSVIILAAGLLFITVFTRYYIPKRLKRMT